MPSEKPAINFIVTQKGNGVCLMPWQPADEALMSGFNFGQVVKAKPTIPRSVKQNNHYWAVLAQILNKDMLPAGLDYITTTTALHDCVKAELGLFKPQFDLNRKQIGVKLLSWAFYKGLDGFEAKVYVRKAYSLLSKTCGFDVTTLLPERAA